MPPLSRRAHVRAVVIAVVLLANLLVALPLPHSVKRSSFDEPVAKEEMQKLSALAASVGVTLTPKELADLFYDTGVPLVALHTSLVAPMKPLNRVLGTGQAWGLFTYPDTFPHRFVIEARTAGGPWERLYAGLDPDHTFLVDVWTYRRVRGVYDGNTTKPVASWDNLTHWAAARVFEAHPAYDTVRVYFERFHTVPPGGKQDPEIVPRQMRTYHKEAM